MSRKSRLFASVAVPFVSLPLMLQPAAAMPPKAAIEAGQMPGVIRVQQQIIVPEGGGEQAPQAEEQQPRRQREAAPEAEAPREAPAAEAPAQERPRRQQAEQGEGGGERERPRRREQQETGESGGEGQQRRERQREQDAPEAEQPAQQPAAREAQQPRDAAPEGGDRQQRRNAEGRDTAPAENQAETPAPRPRRNSENQGGGEGSGSAQGERNRRPAAEQAAPTEQAPAETAPDGTAPSRTTEERPTRAEQPAGQTTDGRPAQPVPGQEPGQAPSEQAAPGQPPAVAPAEQPPQTAQTPQQVERARELARDPSSARSGEQVVLPVENGAAVLDSAKEAPAARPAGDDPRRPRGPRGQQGNQQADRQPAAPPKTDAEAQGTTEVTREQERDFRAIAEERGERLDRRPDFDRPRGWDYRDGGSRDGGNRRDRDRDRDGGRVIISIDNQTVVRGDDSSRFYVDGREPEYDQLRDGRFREVIEREDGTRVVTIRNRYGEIVQRSRVVRGGEEYVLYYAPELMDDRRGDDYVWRDPGLDLPPMRLTVPLDDYIVDTSSEPDRDYYEFLEQPPVERVERVYSLDEVRYSARIRDKVRRIDLDTVTFATGSAEIPMNQASSLRKVAEAISKVLESDPSETFLIEGHTDAVGSNDSNLVLSDERAESVARVLTDAFGIAPENLATQGYGERYLKVRTEAAEQQNRRVTVRRITPLVKPVAARQ